MVCAPGQNGLRSWQNGLRAISDVTDVLGKMICALACAWFALDLRFGLREMAGGACSAAQIKFLSAAPSGTRSLRWGAVTLGISEAEVNP